MQEALTKTEKQILAAAIVSASFKIEGSALRIMYIDIARKLCILPECMECVQEWTDFNKEVKNY